MAQPTHAQLGAAIRSVREEMGLSIEALGAKADVHWTGISVIETGQRNPSWEVVCKLATGLEMDIADLARLAGKQPGQSG